MEGRDLKNKTRDGGGSWVPVRRPCHGGGRGWGVEGAGGLVLGLGAGLGAIWGLEAGLGLVLGLGAGLGVILGLGAGLGVMDAQLEPCWSRGRSPPGGSGRCLCVATPVPTRQHPALPQHLLPGPGARDFGVLQRSQTGEGGLCILCQLMHHRHGNALDAAPSLWISLDIWGGGGCMISAP